MGVGVGVNDPEANIGVTVGETKGWEGEAGMAGIAGIAGAACGELVETIR